MHRTRIPIAILLLIMAALLLYGCGAGAQPIEGAERDAVLAYAEPKAENLLQAFNSGDYAAFARDLDGSMRRAETEAVFTQTRTAIQNKIGKYVARKVTDVIHQDKFVVVLYAGQFENEDGVTMRIVFNPDDAHQISGLWFDSPKLRQK